MQALSHVIFLRDYHVHALESKILLRLVLGCVRDVVLSIISCERLVKISLSSTFKGDLYF